MPLAAAGALVAVYRAGVPDSPVGLLAVLRDVNAR